MEETASPLAPIAGLVGVAIITILIAVLIEGGRRLIRNPVTRADLEDTLDRARWWLAGFDPAYYLADDEAIARRQANDERRAYVRTIAQGWLTRDELGANVLGPGATVKLNTTPLLRQANPAIGHTVDARYVTGELEVELERAADGSITWLDILLEEVAEAANAARRDVPLTAGDDRIGTVTGVEKRDGDLYVTAELEQDYGARFFAGYDSGPAVVDELHYWPEALGNGNLEAILRPERDR